MPLLTTFPNTEFFFNFLNEAQLPGTTQDHLQIFNIEAKAKLKSHQMPEQARFYHLLDKLLCFVEFHLFLLWPES